MSQEWDTLVTQFSDPQTDFAVNTANILQLKTGQPARLKDGDLSQISSYTKAARYETLSVTPVLGEITIDTGLLLPYTLSMPENQVAYERFYHQDYTGVPVDYTITKNEPGCVLNDECDSGSSCNRCLDDECFANGGSYDYDSRTCTIVRHLQVCLRFIAY